MSRLDASGHLVQCLKQPAAPKASKGYGGIRATSVKNAASEAEYDKNRAIRLRLHPTCERCKEARSVLTHHVLRRTPKHSDHSLGNLRALCFDCHDWIHLNVAAAIAAGWLRRRFPKPGDAAYVAAQTGNVA